MYARMMYLAALTLYTVLTAVLLVHFSANILTTVLFLSVIPVVVLWRHEQLQTRIIPIILLIAFGATVAFQATAYINGLWYELSPSNIRVFGLFPIEAFVAAFIHVLYFVVTYEYFFDDRKTGSSQIHYMPYLLAGVSSMVAFGIAYAYLFSGVFLSNAFSLLVLGGTAFFLLGVLFAKNMSFVLLRKVLLFALAIFPVSLAYEYVSLGNDLRFFANFNEYLYVFTFFGQAIPLEELLFMFLVPFWIATIYELYIDDGR